jgi:hypothetical protein
MEYEKQVNPRMCFVTADMGSEVVRILEPRSRVVLPPRISIHLLIGLIAVLCGLICSYSQAIRPWQSYDCGFQAAFDR